MASRFDKRTNVFNQSGRISQIEFAIQAIKNSSPALAIKYANGIAFLTMKRSDSKLSVQPATGDKIFKIDQHVYVMVSGMSADGDRLVDQMRIKG
jgi:20S proteasome alpha/beta subunit